jgi:hypothetical protein
MLEGEYGQYVHHQLGNGAGEKLISVGCQYKGAPRMSQRRPLHAHMLAGLKFHEVRMCVYRWN